MTDQPAASASPDTSDTRARTQTRRAAATAPPSSPAPIAATTPPPGGALAMSVLHEILLALAHGEGQERVLALIADKARLLTGCASTAVALLDSSEGDREFVTFAAVSGEEAQEAAGTRVLAADTITGNTARTGEPYLAFSPAAARPGLSGAAAVPDMPTVVESAAVVPIFSEGQPVGALAALNKAGNLPFGGDDLLCLSTLAAGASVVIAGSHLRTEAQRQGRELSILYEAVRNVSGPLTAQEVLRAVVEQVAAHLASSAVAVFLTNDERTHLYIAADRGLTDEQREVTLATDSGLGAAAFASPRPLFLTFTDPEDEEVEEAADRDIGSDDTSTGARTGKTSSRASRAFEPPFPNLKAPRSALAAPIRSGDVTHGLVLVIGEQSAAAAQGGSAYSLMDANLLSALASQAAVAIENAWLYEDATRRAEEAAALYELSQAVTSTLRQEDVLERVADSILSLLMVDKFALFLREPDSDRLKMVVARGLPAGAAERLRPVAGQGIPGWVMEFETPTAVQDVAADHRNASCPLHGEGVVSLMAVPLQVGAATIGALCAMSARRRLFTVAEMELLYTIANQAAIAIENARMYADARQKSLEQRRYFHRIARILGSSQSPEEVPQLIASLMLEVMGADRCALYSVRRAGDGSDSRFLRMEARAGYRLAGESEEGVSNDTSAQIPVSEETPTGWIARRARSLPVEDIADDSRFLSGTGRPARGRPAVSYLGVPLRSGEEVVGVLEVYTRARRRWRGDEVRLLHTFASQATVAFQNARLARESRRTARRAALLQQLLEMALQQRNGGSSSNRPTIDPAALVTRVADGVGSGAALLERESGSAEEEPSWVCRAASADLPPEEAVSLLLSAQQQSPPSQPAVTFVTSSQDERVFMVRTDESSGNSRGDSGVRGEEDAAIRVILEAALALLAKRERG